MTPLKLKTETLVLYGGIAVLLLGVILFIRSLKAGEPPVVKSAAVDVLLTQLDTAQPRFEIGYAQLNMAFYRENARQWKTNGAGLMTYPVYRNEVAERIETGSPALKPDYSKMKLDGAVYGTFQQLYRKNKLVFGDTSVICLIVKQVGGGRADSVSLLADRVAISTAEDLYDALDLGGNEFYPEGIRKTTNTIQKEAFRFQTMETGTSLLVPLCLTNSYFCPNCEPEPLRWQLASYTAFVPINLSYRNQKGKQFNISLSQNLAAPIYMEK